MVGKALNKLKGTTISRLEQVGLDAILRGDDFDPGSRPERISAVLRKVSDKAIETVTKTSFNLAKKRVSKSFKGYQNAGDTDAKAQTLPYIALLHQQCDIGFQTFREQTVPAASDAELIVLFESFNALYHSVPQYHAALAEKVKRYKKSGVTEIGQREIGPREPHVAPVMASKRCVWLRNARGTPELYFQHVGGHAMSDPWSEKGASNDLERVPDEFVEAAVAKSEQKWGPTPTFDNPSATVMRHMGLRSDSNRSTPAAPPMRTGAPFLQLSDVKRNAANTDPDGAS